MCHNTRLVQQTLAVSSANNTTLMVACVITPLAEWGMHTGAVSTLLYPGCMINGYVWHCVPLAHRIVATIIALSTWQRCQPRQPSVLKPLTGRTAANILNHTFTHWGGVMDFDQRKQVSSQVVCGKMADISSQDIFALWYKTC